MQQSFGVAKGTPTITKLPTATGIMFGAPLSASTLSGGTADVAGTFTFTSPATVPSAAGSYSAGITFTPSDAAHYNTVGGTVNVPVAKATPVITKLPTATGIVFGAPLSASTLSGGTADVAGTFAFTTPATVPSAAGTFLAEITFTPNDAVDYTAATGSVPVAVAKATAAVTLGPLNYTYDNTPKPVTATTNPGNLAVVITYNNSATVPTAAGSYTVLATVNDAYYQGSATGTLIIAKAPQAITFTSTVPGKATFSGTAYTVTANGGASGNPVVFAIDGSTASVCQISGSTVSFIGVGTCVINANQAGNSNYNAAPLVQQSFGVAKATPVITKLPTATGIVFGAPLSASTLSGGTADVAGTFTFTNPATVPSAAGNFLAEITFTPNDAANYTTTTGSVTVAVAKATAAVTLGPLNYTYDNTPKPVTATTNPGNLAVVVTYNNSATVPTAAGSYTVLATVNDAYYQGSATGTLVIAKAPQSITFTSTVPGNATFSGAAYTVTANGGASGNPVVFTIDGSAASVCQISGSTVSFIGVGTCVINANQAGNSNYNAAPQVQQSFGVAKGTPTITKLPTATGIVFGAPLSASTLSGGTADVAGTFTFTTPATVPSAAGSYSAGITFTPSDAAHYTTVGGTVNVPVAKATPVITKLPTATGIVFGAPLSASNLSGGTADVPGTFTFTNPATVPSAAGTFLADITFTPNDAADYTTATGSVTVAVAKATATVTLGSLNYTYDNTPKAVTATTNPGNLAVVITYNNSATVPTAAGSYTVLATINDAYYQGSATGTLVIAKAPQSITFAPVADKPYSAADFNPGATGGDSGNPVTYTSSNSTVATITSGGLIHIVGADTVQITANQVGNGNYAEATGVSRFFTVNKEVITVTADNKNRTYGEANPQFTVTYSGFVKGDDASVLSGSPSITTNATVDSPSGSYSIVPALGTLSAANYSFVFVNGTLGIGLSSQSITFNQIPAVTYGATSFELVYTPGASGEPVTLTSSNPSVATISDKTVTIVGAGRATITAFQAGNGSYASASAEQELVVLKATLAVSAQDLSRPFNTENPTLTYAVSGFVNAETSAVLSGAPEISTTAVRNSPVGSYPIMVTRGTLDAANYDFSFTGAFLAVGQASQSISFAAIPVKKYGDAAFELSATGGASGNVVTFTSSDTAVARVTGNTVAIVGAGSTQIRASQAGDTNYAPAVAQQILTVSKGLVTVSADNASRPYGAANPAFTATFSGFVYDDTKASIEGSVSLGCDAGLATSVGTYPIVVTNGTLFSNNYDFNYVNGVLTIEKATPVITWTNPSDIFVGTALSAIQLDASASVDGSFSYSPADGYFLPAGGGQTLQATFTPKDQVNYASAAKSVTINVLAKSTATVTLGNLAHTYDGSQKSATVSTSPAGLGVTVTYNGSTTPPAGAGSYTVVATVSDSRYQGSATATLVIAKADASVALANLTQSYDGSAKRVTVTTTPASLAVLVTYGGSQTVPSTAGSYLVLATIADANYQGGASGTLNIVPVVNGSCGSAEGQIFTLAPAVGLCSGSSAASSVSGSGPWFWTCSGSGGGTTASCSTKKLDTSGAVAITGAPSGSYSGIKAGNTFTVYRYSSTGAPKVLASNTTQKTFTDGTSLLPNTAYQYAVVSDTDQSATVFMTVRTPLYNGWNIIAIPYNTSGVAPNTFFAEPVSAVYEWIPTGATPEASTSVLGSYAQVNSLSPGKGYFAKTSDGSTRLAFSGTPNSGSTTVTLKPGWTMIANPKTNNLTGIGNNWLVDGTPLNQAVTGNRIGGSLYWWNGTTYDSWTIVGDNPQVEPWKGYWIVNLDSVNHTLTIP
ncbi:hypothetical protein E4633_17180 [Geomonas terrae]|uniref:MBG domain-containing protein n=1 Tax=Geomonas terrae TaxID=2562681 RepID=A0A4S1CBM2_9BACT|nr:hypothetical protein E4633_17180 [Geomonas terrae]